MNPDQATSRAHQKIMLEAALKALESIAFQEGWAAGYRAALNETRQNLIRPPAR